MILLELTDEEADAVSEAMQAISHEPCPGVERVGAAFRVFEKISEACGDM